MRPTLDLALCSASSWQAAPDLGLRLALLAGLLLLAGWVGAQRWFPGQRLFVAQLVVMLGWVGVTTLEHAASDAGCKGALALLAWPVVLLQPVLWALFLARYVRSETGPLDQRLLLGVGVPWLVLSAGAMSNGWHGQLYGDATVLGPPIAGLPRMRYDYGTWFLVCGAWGYGWVLAAIARVLQAWRAASGETRATWRIFLVITAAPVATNVCYLLFGWRLAGGDPTPMTYGLALCGFAWLIYRGQLFEAVPLARRLLFTELPDPVLVLDQNDRVVDANAAAVALAGQALPPGTPLPQWPRFGAELAAALATRERGMLSLAAPECVLDLRVRPLGEGKHQIGRLVQLRDITEQHRVQVRLVQTVAERNAQLQEVAALQAELREQALRDPLTGLYNRRALVQRFAALAGQDLVLALVDADHFKQINDSVGHAGGDAVLCALGERLQAGLAAHEGLFRVGGEEFALLLPGATLATALPRLKACCAQVAASPVAEAGGTVTVSIGCAESGPHGQDLDTLYRAADRALYAAKAAGRNRVVAAG